MAKAEALHTGGPEHHLETKKSSAERSQEGSNLNEAPPDEREQFAPDMVAAAQVGLAAYSARVSDTLEAETRLRSDPRYERDQEIFKLGQQGKIIPIGEVNEHDLPPDHVVVSDPGFIEKVESSNDQKVEYMKDLAEQRTEKQQELQRKLQDVGTPVREATQEVQQTITKLAEDAKVTENEKSDSDAKESESSKETGSSTSSSSSTSKQQPAGTRSVSSTTQSAPKTTSTEQNKTGGSAGGTSK